MSRSCRLDAAPVRFVSQSVCVLGPESVRHARTLAGDPSGELDHSFTSGSRSTRPGGHSRSRAPGSVRRWKRCSRDRQEAVRARSRSAGSHVDTFTGREVIEQTPTASGRDEVNSGGRRAGLYQRGRDLRALRRRRHESTGSEARHGGIDGEGVVVSVWSDDQDSLQIADTDGQQGERPVQEGEVRWTAGRRQDDATARLRATGERLCCAMRNVPPQGGPRKVQRADQCRPRARSTSRRVPGEMAGGALMVTGLSAGGRGSSRGRRSSSCPTGGHLLDNGRPARLESSTTPVRARRARRGTPEGPPRVEVVENPDFGRGGCLR